ncbi:MAG: hypothetical protein QM589_04940 [Thermomicrobiales bacterium]
METLYLKALGLGIAGFDPSGALVAMAFLAAGATRKAVFLFCLVYLTGTILLLTIASVILSTTLPGTDWRILDSHPRTKAVVELAIGIVLLAIATYHHFHTGTTRSSKPRSLPVSIWATAGTGLLLAIGVIGDPALLAFTVVAGTASNLLTIAIAQIVAVVASKILVVVVMIAVAVDTDGQLIERLRTWWTRATPAMGRIVTIVLIVMAFALIVNAAWWFRTDTFIL